MSEHEIRHRDLRRAQEERDAEITKTIESQKAAVAAQIAKENAPPEECKHGNAIKVEGSKDDARWCTRCGALGLYLEGPDECQWFPPKG